MVKRALLGSAALLVIPAVSSAAVLLSDGFDTDVSANYSTFVTPGATGASSDALFGYDYSAMKIPVAPHTTDGSTTGLRLRVDALQASTNANAVGAISVATKNLVLPTAYSVSVDIWGNYIGGTSLASGGTNSTTAVGLGIGTAGTALQSPNGSDSPFFAAIKDGGTTNTDFRIYRNSVRQTPASTFYAAGTGTTAPDNLNTYYASTFPAHTAPADQVTAFPTTQGGSTPVGVVGMAWHTFTVNNDGTNITWFIDNLLIGTVPVAGTTIAGNQIYLTSSDTNLTGGLTTAQQLLNSDIYDNLVISSIPEPTSLGLLLPATLALTARRRRA